MQFLPCVRKNNGILTATCNRNATYFFVRDRYTVVRSRGGEKVYLDVLWTLNFAVDLLLIIAANRMSGYSTSVGRSVFAAVLGGVYGCVCVIPGWTFLAKTLWRLIALVAIGVIAFGVNRTSLRRCILFMLLSMALGGIALGLERGGFFSLLFSAMFICSQ